MIGAFVNDEFKGIDYTLKNNDRVNIITDNLSNPDIQWIDKAQTTLAKRKISEFKSN